LQGISEVREVLPQVSEDGGVGIAAIFTGLKRYVLELYKQPRENNHKKRENMNDRILEFIQKLLANGYHVNYKDGSRYIQLFREFNNSEQQVSGPDEIQIGRAIEICEGEIKSKPFMKRGYLWSGSAETVAKKGNVYTYGNSTIVSKY